MLCLRKTNTTYIRKTTSKIFLHKITEKKVVDNQKFID